MTPGVPLYLGFGKMRGNVHRNYFLISLDLLIDIAYFLFRHGYGEFLGIILVGLCFFNFLISNQNESSLNLYRHLLPSIYLLLT